MDSKEIRVLILSAGKIDSELEKIFGKIPSGLIPLNGKPVIFRIIDKLIDEGINKISITAGYKKEILEKIVSEQYQDRCKIEFISTDFVKMGEMAADLVKSNDRTKIENPFSFIHRSSL